MVQTTHVAQATLLDWLRVVSWVVTSVEVEQTSVGVEATSHGAVRLVYNVVLPLLLCVRDQMLETDPILET